MGMPSRHESLPINFLIMLLILDNYDSFVHNLARYFERLGQTTRVVRNDAIDAAGVQAMRPAAIVLSPGPCTPREAGASLDIVKTLHADVPMLGVCLGHQVIAEALGARIAGAPSPIHGQTSSIRHDGTKLFAGIPSPLTVGRYHSLVVEPDAIPKELRATAWTQDGVLMAFEHTQLPLYGVQFHPESILTEHGYDLLANFLRLAGIDFLDDPSELARTELTRPRTKHPPLPSGPVTF
jgi:anthranilate synthase/aminodeoxychorismate synthase-like glutamine amidotransferase